MRKFNKTSNAANPNNDPMKNIIALEGLTGNLETELHCAIPATQITGARITIATQMKVTDNILMKTWGGLGDQICAAPTLANAILEFKERAGCKISLASEHPELFSHMNWDKVYNIADKKIAWDKYLPIDTIVPSSHMMWQYVNHMITNCVDFPSMCSMQKTLYIDQKAVKLNSVKPSPAVMAKIKKLKKKIVIHAGKHWQSKTFPKPWWDAVLAYLVAQGETPILIGGDADDNRTTVKVETKGCLDLRNKLRPAQTVWLLEQSQVLLTNDSAPLHMAAQSNAWIGFVATVKHQDYITHYRKNLKGVNEFGWRMQHHNIGGAWEIFSYTPNKMPKLNIENVGPLLLQWLPKPEDFAAWGMERLYDSK